MKKLILIIAILAISTQVYSQTTMKNINYVPMANTQINDINTPSAMGGEEALWSEDFGNPIDTIVMDSIVIENVFTQDLAGYGDWHWSTEPPQGMWTNTSTSTTPVIESETPENGFMVIEADFNNSCPQNGIECVDDNNDGINDIIGEYPLNAHFTIGPIDLSSAETDKLVLQFYSDFRICCYPPDNGANDVNVYISTDGENFTDLDYIEGDIYETNSQTATLSQIPLGGFGANVEGVYFRFEWVGTHYYWMIDDISIVPRPAYDLKMQSAWLTMADPASIEYYSIPQNQMPDEMLIGAEIYNYGYNDDIGTTLTGSITSTSYGASIEYDVDSDSTYYIETDYFDVSMLTAGTYEFSAEITSSGNDETTEDNMLTREFVISDNVYAMDGLYSSYDWIAPGWMPGDEQFDGVMYCNYFDFKETATLSSIEIALDTDSHPTGAGLFEPNSGGEMIAYVLDTTGMNAYFQGITTQLEAYMGGVLWQSDFYLISEDDINNAQIVIDVPELELNPNAYYIAIEIYSNGGENNILLWDDMSVVQPYYASMMFSPDDQTWYTNPNCVSIRLGLDGFENKLSEETLEGIHCFPNPSKDYVEIKTDKILNGTSYINLFNILGENVKSFEYDNLGQSIQINLNHLSSGSYILEFENDNKVSRHKLIIE